MSQPVVTNSTALLLIDQEPIRQAATSELQSLLQKMKRLRSQAEDFESVDKPAFMRWLRGEFNESLNELGQLEERLSDAEEIVNEVQMVRLALGCSYHQAYLNTMERRVLGKSFDETIEEASDSDSKSERQTESLDDEASVDQESVDDGEASPDQDGFASTESLGSETFGFWKSARAGAEMTIETIKSKYRELARLLHPDLRGVSDSVSDTWAEELWHRTQTAYSAKNVEELLEILVLARASLGKVGTDSTVSDIREAISHFKKSLRTFRRELNILKQDMAWGFCEVTDRTRLRRRIAYDLEYRQDEVLLRLEALESQLARWSIPPARSRARARQKPRSSWDLELDY